MTTHKCSSCLADGPATTFVRNLCEACINNHTCPRCLGGIPNDLQRGAYPGALSRWDNKTEICSTCGQDEAIEHLLGALTQPQVNL